MRRTMYGLPALLLFSIAACGTLFAQSRALINLDDQWRFHFGHASDPTKDFNYGVAVIFAKAGKSEQTAIHPEFDDSAWERVRLPHDWVVALPFVESPNGDVMGHGYKPVGGLFPATSIGWYRRTFTVAGADSGQRFAIRFDGVYRDCMVWLNGHFLGNNKSGYIGASFDITDVVNFEKPNVLVVRVDATQYEGWFYEGAGIYRHVWLERCHELHVACNGVFIHADVLKPSARVNVETRIENRTAVRTRSTVQTVIADRNGTIVARSNEEPLSLAVNETGSVAQHVSVRTPRVWSLDDPYLYRASTLVRVSGRVVDSVATRFGIRTIAIDARTGVMLNGMPVKLQGVCCHQDHAGVGSALPDALQYYRIGLLKEMGVNAYRTSHHPPTPELLDACDSLGMLVMDETRLLNSGGEYLGQLERLIERDRNHPSVFIWSIGNEEGYIHTTSVGKRIALTMLARQRALDPTRMSTYAADVANVFTGVNEVIPVRGFNYRVGGIVPYHADHPAQPVVGTEMGSTVTTRGIYLKDTVRCYVPDQDITFPWWANRAEDWWPLAADSAWMMGGFVWTGFDYRGEPTPYRWPNISSHFGIMDVCGFPKNIYYYYQSWWKTADVLHISPHWNWPDSLGRPMTVWVNSNADSVQLLLNGNSLGVKAMPRNRHLEWSVHYAPGAIEARAWRNGKTIAKRVETTGRAERIVLEVSKRRMHADGTDALVVNVSAVDARGREVPDAQQLIRFSVTGDAKMIGVGNGDPSSHEPDKCEAGKWQRRLFNGKCQLIVQAGVKAGAVSVNAESAELASASVEIAMQ